MTDQTDRTDHSPPTGGAPAVASRAVELFPTDRPLATDELFGRDDQVASLVDDLNAGNHRCLIGAHNSGKTSVALAAAGELGAEWTVVAVDLFRVAGLDRLADALLRARPLHLDPETSKCSIGTAIGQLDTEAADEGRRILLYVDSFHELATTQIFGKIAEVGKELRAALDATTHTTALFVGGASTVMRDMFTSKGQPFHQLATVTTLGRVEPAAWRTGLSERFDRGGCPAGDAALDRLLAVGEQHARSTMLIAQHAYALAVTAGNGTLSVDAVDAGVESALAGERSLADHRLAQVRGLSKHALTTALRVAAGESPYKNLPPAMARQTLRGLETAGVVDHPKSGAYMIGDPLLRRYLIDVSTGGDTLPQPGRIDPVLAAALSQVAPEATAAPTSDPALVEAPAVEEPPDATTPHPVVEQPSANKLRPEPAHSPPAAEVPAPSPAVAPGPTVAEPAADPEPGAVVESEPVESESVEPESVEPESVEPESVEPESVEPESVEPDAGLEPIPAEFAVVEPAAAAEPGAVVEPEPVEPDAGLEPIAAEFVVIVPAVEPKPTANEPVAGVESVAATTTPAAPAGTDRRRLRLRHPRRDEADEVHDCVTNALEPPASERSRGSRLGRFVRHAVATDPDQYWQVEAGKRPVGGVVLHEPGSTAGWRLGPLAHAGFLAGTCVLLVFGLVLLVVTQAWNWGAYAGLIFAAFIAALVHVVQLAPRVVARARASLAARRHSGHVVAAVWSESDALLEVFRQLAREMPGKHLAGYAESPAHAAAFRDIGFSVGRNRIVEGILDPGAERPVRSTTDTARPVVASGPSARPDVAAHRAATATRPALRSSTAHRAKHRRHSNNKRHRR